MQFHIYKKRLLVSSFNYHSWHGSTVSPKSLSAERRPSCINDHEQYYDDVSEDDTILDLINDAIETERQKEIPSMSVEEFLDSLDNISDEEINACSDTDDQEDQEENCETPCKDDDSCTTSDINNNANEFIIVSDDDDDNINDERSLMTIDNSTVQQTVILTFQRTLTTIDGQTYVSDLNMEQDIYEHFIQ
ncbi:unnamed protein product [Mytilus edulis]|uniref:Uncharacterized protein n=1 Tax=Mytilus edulis TaxID=6550 RepID=A0A8S3TGG9_MYTED|nr:unnamed protein product [Mytilus edulis]